MKTLIDHAESLSRYCDETVDEIVALILNSKFIMDDDSLLCYEISENPFGQQMEIYWADGDGKKIWEWVKQVSRENHCVNIYMISRRWKAFCRKYKFSPIGVMCKRDGFR